MAKRSTVEARAIPERAAAPRASASLGDLIDSVRGMLRRRLWTLVIVTVAITALALGVIMTMTPSYDATTRIRIDPSRNPMSQDQTQSTLNAEAIETEVGVMTSVELAREVTRRLHLERDPEFAPPAEAMQGASADERLNQVARRVMRRLNVGRDRLSYIIALTFRSRNADTAARVANTYADAYMDLRVRSQVGTSSRQAEFFQKRLAELGATVNAADARLADYRARAGISENNGTATITDQQIAPLSTQLATAESEAAAARSNAATAQSQVARGGLDAVSEVRSSAVIADLRRQRAEIVRNKGEVEARYGPRHPESIRVRDQLAAIDQQIRDEANRVVTSLQAQASSAEAQVASLRGTMRSLQGERAINTRASAQAERLEREAASARAAYDKMSQLSLESTQASRSSIAQAEIVDRAQPPSAPSAPKRALLAALSAAVAFAIALAVVLILEVAQGGLRTVEEIDERYGLPVLASVPRDGPKRRLFGRRRDTPADSIDGAGATAFGEAIRNLRTSLIGLNPAAGTRVFAVTSALPDEGKTTTSLSLARMLAINGTPTLLIDCDLRKASLRALTEARPAAGLVEVLAGEAAMEQALVPDRVDGLQLVTVASALFTSQDLFGDERMARLLDEAKARFGAIILDLPPVLGVADARTLAKLADSVAFVIRWGQTAPKATDLALSSLDGDGANVAGIVFAMVDPASEAAGGMYYSKSYNRYYRKG